VTEDALITVAVHRDATLPHGSTARPEITTDRDEARINSRANASCGIAEQTWTNWQR
jgi:hypothetical protein